MISFRTKNKVLYVRAAMVIITIVFGAGLFCGSNSNFQNSPGYKYGGLEEIEFHQALPVRLFIYEVILFCIGTAPGILSVITLLGSKSLRPKTFYTIVRPSYAFNRTITINAP